MFVTPLTEYLTRYSLSADHPTVHTFREIYELSDGNLILAGGAVLALITGDSYVKDFDFFFSNEESLHHLRENLLALPDVQEIDITDNAYTLKYRDKIIQLIRRVYADSADSLFTTFDISLCKVALVLRNSATEIALCAAAYALEDLAKKEIHIGTVYSIGHTIKRVVKYATRGYIIPQATYARLFDMIRSQPSSQLTEVIRQASTRTANTYGQGNGDLF